ncbi:MarR family winged helix-turn-helix transcriptional regulator [Streptomyces kronopolitis]|uniref:MarR family winged helix-turn-helix transcriptional regulator n=1 Tax=Streptomyces kronopolitis TaxID=1612435 RepID=UPI003417E7D7
MVAHFSDGSGAPALGPQLLRSWIGYRRRVEQKLASSGFTDRRLPDGMLLRLCVAHEGLTLTRIGREMQISRQGASKLVADLCERGFLSLEKSPGDGREKIVRPTPEARAFLQAFRAARREVDEEIREQLGAEAVQALTALTELLGEPSGAWRSGDIWREVRSRSSLLDLGDL